ncbi:uncharacterized protein VTP21DRAFT_1020 [Calcarisporiella thermophila]|uniref:uncharacterized protein n=1 Tax=Calcarisporiella thermophila TaxID=911321 RepID=UPI0037434C84
MPGNPTPTSPPSSLSQASSSSESVPTQQNPNDPVQESKEQRRFERWRRSLMYITGIGLSESEKEKIMQEREKEFERYECNRCEKWRDSLMKNSPAVVFMLQHLDKIGCRLEKHHFQCMPCDKTRSGGFSPEHGIQLCQNRFFSKAHMEDTMVHEMIHMFDHCRFKVNWNDCYHHACSEVRAASLSGDCRLGRELRRGYFQFTKQHQACARRRAILSVKQNPACSEPGVAERAVAAVFDSCFNDTRPFDEIYK